MTTSGGSDLSGLLEKHNSAMGGVPGFREELDNYLSMMQEWSYTDPDIVMKQISSIAARLIQIRCEIIRTESRANQSFRTKELDPVLDQLGFQFKIHSRRLSSMQLDWDVAKGQ